MKRRRTPILKAVLLTIILIAMSAAISAREGGGWSGNGGGFHQGSDNIWFLGNKPVPYCLVSAEDFPLNKSQLQYLVRQSFQSWRDFFKKYHLDDAQLTGGFFHPRMNGLTFLDGKNRGLNFNFVERDCDGKEQLTFYFGVQNKIIDTYRNLLSEHPYGLAIRKNYDHKNFENSGLVWISNTTKELDKIKHTLLHELGHVFGMKHNSVFVMDEDMAWMLSRKSRLQSEFIGKIESDAWVYRFQKDKPLILTSRRGRRERPRAGVKLCGDPTYAPNRLLPRAFHGAFDFKKGDCHRVTLTLKGSLFVRKGTRLFDMKVKELGSGKEILLKGTFKPSKGARPELLGPGVFTSFRAPLNPNRSVWRRLTLDKELPDTPLTGYFEIGGVKMASKLTSYKGTVLEVFLPGKGHWWTLKTIFNQ